jgi:hypothetical protein
VVNDQYCCCKQLLDASGHILSWELVALYNPKSSVKTDLADIVPEYNQVHTTPCKACQRNNLASQDCLQYKGCCAAEKSASKFICAENINQYVLMLDFRQYGHSFQ